MYQKIIVAAVIILQAFFGFYMYNMNKSLEQQNNALSDSFIKINANTDGKIEALQKNITTKIAETQIKTVSTDTVSYVEKAIDATTHQLEDTDVELKTQPSSVVVKVNDGKKYNFDYLPQETNKFEKGKLVMESKSSTYLDIRADEPKLSKFTILAMSDTDKHVKGGLFYNINNTVSAGVMAGEGIKPHYGVLLKIGGHK